MITAYVPRPGNKSAYTLDDLMDIVEGFEEADQKELEQDSIQKLEELERDGDSARESFSFDDWMAAELKKFADKKKKSESFKTKTITMDHNDPVDHPAHYTSGGIETIDFIEAKGLGFNLGNVVKYVTRAGKKEDLLQDLKKARWYLDREIKQIESKA